MAKRKFLRDVDPKAFDVMLGFENYLAKSSLNRIHAELIKIRVSQINGCAYCLDMHSKDLLATGENPQRLFLLDAWREAPLYSARERAALVWAEAVTKITNGDVPDEVYAIADQEFSEEELIDLTLAITTINAYNRFNISFRTEAGGYKVGQHKVQTA